jgi:predicted alpha/beta hydrolase family esterase
MCEELARSPLCLIIPGLGGSGPDHWQTRWEAGRHDCERVDLGSLDSPARNQWVSGIERAVRGTGMPIVLVAHSLGCHAVAWWAELMVGSGVDGPVVGALLVAPPDVDRGDVHPLLSRFSPSPRGVLPFPSIVVASSNDPFASLARSREMAGNWMSEFVDIGAAGHINADSNLGDWREGQALLERLCDGRAVPLTTVEPLRQPMRVRVLEPS